jgi:uncharacterized membrane protein YphA (DoxX/SURF4 family)
MTNWGAETGIADLSAGAATALPPRGGLLRFSGGLAPRWGYHLLRLLLAGVFLWSGIGKSLAPADFARVIEAYGLLPAGLTGVAALILIAAEIAAAAGLLLERRGALTAITAMLLLFVGVLGYGIVLGLDIDCGCFGPDDPEAQAFHDLRGALWRDLLLLLAAGYLYLWRHFNRLVPSPWRKRGSSQRTILEEA